MSRNYYSVTKTTADTESVSLDITDAFFHKAADIIVGGLCQLSGVCVDSAVAGNIGKAYHATIHFVYRNDEPFLLLDSSLAYEYDGMTVVPAAMTDGGTYMGVTVTGTDFGTTDNVFVWNATYLLTYIEGGIGS